MSYRSYHSSSLRVSSIRAICPAYLHLRLAITDTIVLTFVFFFYRIHMFVLRSRNVIGDTYCLKTFAFSATDSLPCVISLEVFQIRSLLLIIIRYLNWNRTKYFCYFLSSMSSKFFVYWQKAFNSSYKMLSYIITLVAKSKVDTLYKIPYTTLTFSLLSTSSRVIKLYIRLHFKTLRLYSSQSLKAQRENAKALSIQNNIT